MQIADRSRLIDQIHALAGAPAINRRFFDQSICPLSVDGHKWATSEKRASVAWWLGLAGCHERWHEPPRRMPRDLESPAVRVDLSRGVCRHKRQFVVPQGVQPLHL